MKETGDGGQETGGSDVGLRSPVFGLRSSVLTPLKSERSSAGLNLMRCLISAVPLLVVLGFASVGQAVGVAPRISDREIIESLAELKAGQQALQQRIDDLRRDMNQRFGQVDQRFDDMNRRFDDLNRRFDDVMRLLQILIGALVLVLVGMLAWLIAIWRRLVRVEERQRAFETQDDEIKFLKESYGRLQEMFTRLLERS